jgi:hypothetical protein
MILSLIRDEKKEKRSNINISKQITIMIKKREKRKKRTTQPD